MEFGVPNQRRTTAKVEQFPNTAVMTLCEAGGKGTSRKISFNRKAIETLGLPETNPMVAFSFPTGEVPRVLNADQANVPNEYGIKVTKAGTISHKRTFDYITSTNGLTNDVEHNFELTAEADSNGVVNFSFSLMNGPANVEAENVADVDANDVAADTAEPAFTAGEGAQAFGSFDPIAEAASDAVADDVQNQFAN